MRRRQAFAAQSAAREAALSSQHLGPSEPVNILPKPEEYAGGPLTVQPLAKFVRVPLDPRGIDGNEPITIGPDGFVVPVRDLVQKGQCEKCGRKIGKGIAMHRKACKG